MGIGRRLVAAFALWFLASVGVLLLYRVLEPLQEINQAMTPGGVFSFDVLNQAFVLMIAAMYVAGAAILIFGSILEERKRRVVRP
jgi:hypothetical protein